MGTEYSTPLDVRRFVWDTLEANGFVLDWVGYNADYHAIVVEYTNSSEKPPDDLFLDDVPLLAQVLEETIDNGADPDIYRRLITFVTNPEAGMSPRTGLRWTIEREWTKKFWKKSKIKALYRDVSKTLTSIEEDGAHDVDVSLTFV